MKKLLVFVLSIMLLLAFVFACCMFADYRTLHNDVIRLHVVANSDDPSDQQLKLQVRDAVLQHLESSMQHCSSREEAYQHIANHLTELEALANDVLQSSGSCDTASVCLKDEAFDTRYYDTFTLPAGVYTALRVNIGDAEGKNWWCVVFPTLCVPTNVSDFEDTAAGYFGDGLCKTITEKKGYEVRFYIIDLMGKVENFFKTSINDL